jgi:hypothetical protein
MKTNTAIQYVLATVISTAWVVGFGAALAPLF